MSASPCTSLAFLCGSALAERLRAARTLAVLPFETPWGRLILAAAGDVLLLCDWLENRYFPAHAKRIEETCEAFWGGGPEHRLEALEAFCRAMRSGSAWRFPNKGHENPAHACLGVAADWLERYLLDARRPLPALSLGLLGTDGQCRIWAALSGIAPGETVSYGQFALRAGVGSARAAGQAVGRNAFSILLPCHRVVGPTGAATGYAGGLAAKRGLLAHEGVRLTSARSDMDAGRRSC